MKSQMPPKPPKPVSESDERRQVQNQLKRYNCTLNEELSTQARLLGLEEGKTVCSFVNIAVQKYINEIRVTIGL
jgi:hypothetical protein